MGKHKSALYCKFLMSLSIAILFLAGMPFKASASGTPLSDWSIRFTDEGLQHGTYGEYRMITGQLEYGGFIINDGEHDQYADLFWKGWRWRAFDPRAAVGICANCPPGVPDEVPIDPNWWTYNAHYRLRSYFRPRNRRVYMSMLGTRLFNTVAPRSYSSPAQTLAAGYTIRSIGTSLTTTHHSIGFYPTLRVEQFNKSYQAWIRAFKPITTPWPWPFKLYRHKTYRFDMGDIDLRLDDYPRKGPAIVHILYRPN